MQRPRSPSMRVDWGDVSILETHTLNDDDIYAANTLEDQNRVTLAPNETARIDGGQLTVELPPVSWTAIALG
jgi:alpha-N-arabinofuranosidase